MTATIEDYRWLVSNAAERRLLTGGCLFGTKTRSGNELSKIAAKLRKDLTAEQAHLVLEQIELRQRARDKFSLAERMFFTRKGLEQATDEQIAAYKASRFPREGRIVDLCCGIGGDLIALAQRGSAQGVERDQAAALFAAANASAHGLQERCTVVEGDAISAALGGSAWHCDPDRRQEGRRATRGELFDPPLDPLTRLLEQSSDAAIKLAPATEAPPEWEQSAELEWISSRGECRQQVAWFGRLALHPGRHAATIVAAGRPPRTIVGNPDQSVPTAPKIGRYIYEPDAAVLAAELSAALCRQHSLAAVSAGVAYLTSDQLVDDPALDAFEVLDVLPLDRKQLKAYCREHHYGRLEIKKRGVDLSPEQLRKEIVGDGDKETTIIVSPVQEQVKAIIARRVAPPPTTPPAV